ncbi:MAG TPA: TolC family protein, partial [Candidatus Sulfotelmatobacter sp.]|nr:TolC family protein [Candidatus Sulfotelmatobacter sp.]
QNMSRLDRTLLRFIAGLLTFMSAGGPGNALFAQEVKPSGVAVISLSDAIHRAEQNEPTFASALATQKSAAIDRYLSKAALLPSVVYHNQALYTQPNGQMNQVVQGGAQASPIFIANNAVHEYVSQASISETVGLKQFADAQVAAANAARASAELEVARRGLILTVVSLYYSVSASETREHVLEEAFREAQSFTELTQKRETAREGAHADVVKAQLQQQQRQRDLSDGKLAKDKARLELAVLLFPDPRTPFLTEKSGSPPAFPSREDVTRLASANNPEIRRALAEVQAGNAEVTSARAAYLPDLGLNFSYGIDAAQFAKRGPDDVQNLGYSISATLDIPVWDWFSTQKRIKQSEIKRDAARVTATAAQRKVIAALEEVYAEAVAARNQLDLLDLSVRTAEESLRLTKLRYSAGEATAFEVVDAETAYLSAETAQADGVVRYEAALAGLQVLTGTL